MKQNGVINIFGRKVTAFFDRHDTGCSCSYCGDGYNKPLHYGLNIPPAWKSHNSWWVIKFATNRYFRWTNSWRRFTP